MTEESKAYWRNVEAGKGAPAVVRVEDYKRWAVVDEHGRYAEFRGSRGRAVVEAHRIARKIVVKASMAREERS